MDDSRSSLPYQIFLSMSKWFLPAFVIIEVLLFSFKVSSLPYPSGNIVSEVFLLVFYVIIEYGRIMSGERGNLTEKSLFVVVSLILSVPACTVLVYMFMWQTYVLRVEVVVVGAAMALQALQVALALVVLLGLAQSSSKVA
ncbi:hypothetical protein FHG87_011191, partial [Trinorchestia longiramus]